MWRMGRVLTVQSKLRGRKARNVIMMQWIFQVLASMSLAQVSQFCSCGSSAKASIMIKPFRRFCSYPSRVRTAGSPV